MQSVKRLQDEDCLIIAKYLYAPLFKDPHIFSFAEKCLVQIMNVSIHHINKNKNLQASFYYEVRFNEMQRHYGKEKNKVEGWERVVAPADQLILKTPVMNVVVRSDIKLQPYDIIAAMKNDFKANILLLNEYSAVKDNSPRGIKEIFTMNDIQLIFFKELGKYFYQKSRQLV
jgi:hypothetical protein